jgi:hypothetical protein
MATDDVNVTLIGLSVLLVTKRPSLGSNRLVTETISKPKSQSRLSWVGSGKKTLT